MTHPIRHNRRAKAVAKAKAAQDPSRDSAGQLAILLGGALFAGAALMPLLDLLLRLIRP